MEQNESVNQRIRAVIDYYRLNVNSFSKRIGLDNNTIIGKLVNMQNRKPSYETLVRILDYFPKLSCRWLLTGEGEMFTEAENNYKDAKSRLLHIMDMLHIDINRLAERSKLPVSDLDSVINGNVEPTIKMFDSVLTGFPEVNSDWLYQCKGEMFRKDRKEE